MHGSAENQTAWFNDFFSFCKENLGKCSFISRSFLFFAAAQRNWIMNFAGIE
jgi:hypothetical protein